MDRFLGKEKFSCNQTSIGFSSPRKRENSYTKMTANKFLLQEMDDGVGCLEIQKVLEQE
jgi:hypothetical protein